MKETSVDLHLLVVFAAVAEHASFSRAAQKLGVGKGTVSRSIVALEAQLGVELVHRTTRQVSLSTAGAALFERARPHLTELRRAVVDLPERDEAPSGLLRLTAPPDFGAVVLPPVLAGFTHRFPGIRLDVRLTSDQVDLVKDGYDLAIRVATRPLKDSSLTVRRLGRDPSGFFAAPSYLARRGRPRELRDPRHTWVLHPGAARMLQLRRDEVAFMVDDFLLARDLLREGVGIGVLPGLVAKSHVRDGLLEEVPVPDQTPVTAELVMLYPSSGQTPRKVSAFRDFVVDAMRGVLR